MSDLNLGMSATIAVLRQECDDLRSALEATEVERDALRERLARVEALHVRIKSPGALAYCNGCGVKWPCPTIKELTS